MAHLDAELGVEIRQRFVEQQHARADDDRAGERDALLLAAGELAGELLLVSGETDLRQHVADALPDLGGGEIAHAQPVRDILEDRQMREQRIVLEHEADVALVRRLAVTSWPPNRMRPASGIS